MFPSPAVAFAVALAVLLVQFVLVVTLSAAKNPCICFAFVVVLAVVVAVACKGFSPASQTRREATGLPKTQAKRPIYCRCCRLFFALARFLVPVDTIHVIQSRFCGWAGPTARKSLTSH